MTKAVDEVLLKRSELSNRHAAIKAEIAKIDQDLEAFDWVLSLLDPTYRAEKAVERPSPRGRTGLARGELSEGILEVLRDHQGMTALECAARRTAFKGLGREEMLRLTSNVAAALTYLSKRNRVQRFHNDDSRSVSWRIAL